MNTKRGFTLIEIVVSLAILGIISAGFLTILSSNFIIMNRTKKLSQNAFEIQQIMEMKIDNVKKDIIDNKTPPNKSSKMTIWKALDEDSKGVEVNYYEIEENRNNKVYATLVTDIKPKVIQQIELKELSISLKQNTYEVPYGYGTGGFSIVGSFKNDDIFKYDHLLNVVEWYVSSSDFTMPIPIDEKLQSDLNEDVLEASYYYPIFPRDYIIVKNETIDNFGNHVRTITDLETFKGKNIIFTVTPGAKSGRIGKQSVSTPVFLSGLPITNDLVIHLDAGFLDPYNSNGTDETEGDGTKTYVKKWNNLSSIFGNEKPNEFAEVNTGYGNPELIKTEMYKEFKGQYVRVEQNQALVIKNQDTNNSLVQVFAVVRNRNSIGDSIFMKNGTKELRVSTNPQNKNSNWVIVKEFYTSTNDDFELGISDVDIAEIIVYKGNLDTASTDKVEAYLKSKYKLD